MSAAETSAEEIAPAAPAESVARRRWLPVTVAGILAVILMGLVAFPRGFAADRADPVGGGYYQRLADGFLHGELGIRERPPEWLLRARDPFDPTTNEPFRRQYGIWDSTLANDRLYYYWGPVPVVLFVVPFHVVGIDITETDVGIAALVVLIVFSCVLVRLIAARVAVPRIIEFLLALGIATGFSWFHLLRRVAVYESTVLVAAAFAMISLCCFVATTLHSSSRLKDRTLWIVGGISLALAIGTRITYLSFCLVPVAAAVLRYREQRRRIRVQPIVLSLTPTLVVLGALGAYNAERFGSITDIGQTRTLGGFNQSKMVLSSFSYTLPNLYYYLGRPFGISHLFPYITFTHFNWPFGQPSDYQLPIEPVAGVVWTSPLLVLGAVLALVCLRRALRADASVAWLSAGATALAILQLLLISTVIYGATQRYRLEVDVPLAVAAAGSIPLAFRRLSPGKTRTAFTVALAMIVLYSVIVTMLGAFHGVNPGIDPGNGLGQRIFG